MQMNYDALFGLGAFDLAQTDKDALYTQWTDALDTHHRAHCPEYRRLTDVLGAGSPLPVRLFKEYDLRSVARDVIKKTMTSSGTTGQAVSKIYLDRDTSVRQTKALSRIVSSFLHSARLPMLIIDSKSVLKDRKMFSARGAGILGFSMLGRDMTYALDDNMALDRAAVDAFCARHTGQPVMLFGFTSIIWEHFCLPLLDNPLSLDGFLIHGGGWKKLAGLNIDNDTFKQRVSTACGIERIHNYYGMVEQTGSIFMECEAGHLHASVFSDVIIRRPQDFSVAEPGERGFVQCVSLLPTSYPGHNLLTEDEGALVGIDDCPCGRKGKYFTIYGRMPGAEIRGCSDTYERK